MKLFKCQSCSQLLYFENTRCERCRHRLGYLPETATLFALEPEEKDWSTLGPEPRAVRFCTNATHDICNWLVPAGSSDTFCAACRHNRTIPNLGQPENLPRWRKLEVAKHHLFYSLMRLGLPLANRVDDPEHGLVFDFLADAPEAAGPKVLTGHDNGVITLNVKEADDHVREAMRAQMHEPYRTLLGHFRHEVGHYFWDVLVRDGGFLDDFRDRFGDERVDYAAALQKNYADGPPPDWQEHFVSAYASCHPWEDFAETWAHYLHIVDTLEMAAAFSISVQPRITRDPDLAADIDFDPHRSRDIHTLVDAWLPLTFAVNSLNRAMGQPDLYPFILSTDVIDKLGFIHRIVHVPMRSDV